MKVGIRKISELTGYSLATVSNVLNNKKGVNADTAKRILKVAREVGYLSKSKMDSIKLIMYKKSGRILTETPLISALLDGIERESRQNGYDMGLYSLQEESPDFEQQLSQILNERSSGILLLATEMECADIQCFSKLDVPLVVLDAWFEDGNFDTVLMNNQDSAHKAVLHLIEYGHREIGYLCSNIVIRNFHYRGVGYRCTMRQHGLKVNDAFRVPLDPTINGSYQDMKRYLSNQPKLPTAYYADNDIIAIGAMRALQENGYRIPDDISIVGFDNMPFSEIASPPLTTLHVYKSELGELAVKRLIAQSQSESTPPAKTEILTQLISRGSVKRLER